MVAINYRGQNWELIARPRVIFFEALYEDKEIVEVNLPVAVEIGPTVPSRGVGIGAEGIDKAEEVVEIDSGVAVEIPLFAQAQSQYTFGSMAIGVAYGEANARGVETDGRGKTDRLRDWIVVD